MRYKRLYTPITTEVERDGILWSLETVAAASLPSSIFVEIGTRFAGSSYEIISKLKTILVDFFFIGIDRDKNARRFFVERALPLGTNNQRVEFVLGYSYEVIERIPRPIAWVFVDGCHSHDACKLDCEMYGELICPGGHLVLHDTRARRPYGLRKYIIRSSYLGQRFRLIKDIDDINGLRVYERRPA